MSRRLLAITIISTLLWGLILRLPSSDAASFPSGKIALSRNARLPKKTVLPIANKSSSSRSSLTHAEWIAFRLSKRRGGGGSGQPSPGSSGSTGGSSNSSAAPLTSPTITFGNITKEYDDAPFTLSPVSDSSGAFTFESDDPSVATVSGDILTITGVGTATISATQAAHGQYAAGTATATLTVHPIAPTIVALLSISKESSDPPFLLSDPESNSSGAFTFTSTNAAVATVSGRTVTIVGAGTTTIVSTQAAHGNYTSGSGSTTLTVSPIINDAA